MPMEKQQFSVLVLLHRKGSERASNLLRRTQRAWTRLCMHVQHSVRQGRAIVHLSAGLSGPTPASVSLCSEPFYLGVPRRLARGLTGRLSFP